MKTSYIFWPFLFMFLSSVVKYATEWDLKCRELDLKKKDDGVGLFLIPSTPPMPKNIPESKEGGDTI